MSAMELLSVVVCNKRATISNEETLLVEAALFSCLCIELDLLYMEECKVNIQTNNVDLINGDGSMDTALLYSILRDILSTEEYTLSGISLYTGIHEDLLHDLLSGNNKNPSLTVSRKIIELHRSVRPALYQSLITKIVSTQKHIN